jgi:hypothetical protein
MKMCLKFVVSLAHVDSDGGGKRGRAAARALRSCHADGEKRSCD